ncbi:MAG: AAA family ATPase [Candidatus Pacearchaeota archaeon]|jgi:exonuclease SbcC
MIIKRIKISNIRSYENAELVLPSGSTLLSGDIGSGKTSILLAIEFALFGLQPGQKGASLLKNGKDEGSVEIEIEIDNQDFIITRTLKRKKSIGQESSFITINGKTEEKSVNELKNYVLNLLNYPPEFAKKTNLLYRFTVYAPQEEMKQIILENPEVRLNTLRHIFGIDKYKRIKENSTILISRLKEISKLKQGEISELETKKDLMKNRMEELVLTTNKIPEIEKKLKEILDLRGIKEKEIKEIDEKIDEKKKLENEVDKASIMLFTKKEQLVKTEKEIANLKMRVEETKKSFSQEEFDELNELIKSKRQEQEGINKEVIQFSTKITSLVSKKSDLESLKNKISGLKCCPTCLQDVGDMHKNNILSQTEGEIGLINTEKINLDNERQQKEITLKQLNSELLELDRKKGLMDVLKIRMLTIEDDRKRVDDLEKQKSALDIDMKMLSEQINRLKESVSEMKKFDMVMKSKESELAEIIRKEREIEINKAEVVKEIEFGKREISNLELEIERKEKSKQELMYLMEIESWVSNQFLEMISFIERNVMLKLRDEFSKLFSTWFSILVPDNFEVRLDEEFTPIIEQQDFQLDYDYLSGGERTAIALAYRLALNQTINSLLSEIKTKGIVILDEPTDGFSQQQLDKMRDVLQELNVKQLLIVSHDQKIESFVENIVRLKKENGLTTISQA